MSQCYCPQCGHGTDDFEMTVTEMGYIMLVLCPRCHTKTESLVHMDILAAGLA